jgi:hypothetical protein
MEWVYRSLMAASVIVGGLVSANILPPDVSALAVAIAASAGYFATRTGVCPIHIESGNTPPTQQIPNQSTKTVKDE